jgi:uncharacterized protein (TIGR02246 family)
MELPVKACALLPFLALFMAACQSPPPLAARAAMPPSEACQPIDEAQVAALFERWNRALATGDPHKVAANYAPVSILLPTVSNTPRLSVAEKEDYFHHFLANGPSGRIDRRQVHVGCNTAVDAGLYTFQFAKTGAVVKARYSFSYRWTGNDWLITSHHSSAMPER